MSGALDGRLRELERAQAERTRGDRLPVLLMQGDDGVIRTMGGEDIDLDLYRQQGIRPFVIVELTEEDTARMKAEREAAKAQRGTI